MPSNEMKNQNDVYKHLVEGKDNYILSRLSFAIFEERKIDWMLHYRSINGSYPTEEEIIKWYSNQPYSEVIYAYEQANSRLRIYLEDSLTSKIEEIEKNIKEGYILKQLTILDTSVRQIKSKWSEQVLLSLVSNSLFLFVLAGFTFVVLINPDVIGWVKGYISGK